MSLPRPTMEVPADSANTANSRRTSRITGQIDLSQQLVVCRRKNVVPAMLGVHPLGQSSENPWNNPAQIIFPDGVVSLGTRTPLPESDSRRIPQAHLPGQVNIPELGNMGFQIAQDDPFFIVASKECTEDVSHRIKYGRLVLLFSILNVGCAAALYTSGEGSTSRVSGSVDHISGTLWFSWSVLCSLVIILGSARCSGRRNLSGILLTVGFAMIIGDCIGGLLRLHSISGVLQVICHGLLILVVQRLRSVWSPIWFSPTMA